MTAALFYLVYFLIGSIPAFVANMKRPPVIITFMVANALIGLFVGYVTSPNTGLGFMAPYIAIFAGSLIALGVTFISDMPKEDSNCRLPLSASIILLIFLLFAMPFVSSTWLHAERYHDLLSNGQVAAGELVKDIEVIDQNQVRVVDEASAMKRGEELLGAEQALGSRVNIGAFTMQAVKGKLWWIAPLEHNGFFAWNTNGSTPAYIMVSAIDYRDAKLVTSYGDKHPVHLRYGLKAYFGDDLVRHLRNGGYADTGFSEFMFEVDEDGKPYWVVPTYVNSIGWDGEKIDGVLTVDAETGEIRHYNLGEEPDWVDRVQPEGTVYSQISYWGSLVHGAFNMSGTDTLAPSKEMSVVYGKDGHAKYYVDMQTTGADDGTNGFMLVDTRTGQATFYPQNGASVSAAKTAIEGKVQQFRYGSTNPILYEVTGVPTYVSTLKDGGGNIKGIGMVSVADRSTVAFGETPEQALKSYQAALGRQSLGLSASAVKQVIDGTVERVGQETINGATTYYLGISGHPGIAYAGQEGGPALIMAKIGDHVRLTVVDGGETIVPMSSFENLDFPKRAHIQ